jgi:hypothetical protein
MPTSGSLMKNSSTILHTHEVFPMRIFRSSRLFVLTLAPLVLFACGCSGKKTADIEGTVKLDGKEVPLAQIRFIPASGKAADEKMAEVVDGKFTAKKVPIGDGIKVVVDTEKVKQSRVNVEAATRKLAEAKKAKADIVKMAENQPAGAQKPDLERFNEAITTAEKELKEVQELAKKFKDVPKKYADEKTTTATVNIKAGEPIEIELTSK